MIGQFNPKKVFFFYDFLVKPCYKQNNSLINFAKKIYKNRSGGVQEKKRSEGRRKIKFVRRNPHHAPQMINGRPQNRVQSKTKHDHA